MTNLQTKPIQAEMSKEKLITVLTCGICGGSTDVNSTSASVFAIEHECTTNNWHLGIITKGGKKEWHDL